MAQKLVHQAADRDMASILKAVRKLEGIEHRHLIVTLGSFTEKRQLRLLLYPWAVCDLGDLLEQIDQGGHQMMDFGHQLCVISKMNSEETRSVFSTYLQQLYGCVANAVEYLHSQGVCIGELKPGHILLWREGPCLTDFGLSKPPSSNGIRCQSYLYYAPEASSGAEPSLASDVFSLACCFLEICTVLNGLSLEDFRKGFPLSNSDHVGRPTYEQNLKSLHSWIEQLRSRRQPGQLLLPYTELDLFALMLRENPSTRPAVRRVVFYFDCLEGHDHSNTGGCIYHRACCRPRRFETG